MIRRWTRSAFLPCGAPGTNYPPVSPGRCKLPFSSLPMYPVRTPILRRDRSSSVDVAPPGTSAQAWWGRKSRRRWGVRWGADTPGELDRQQRLTAGRLHPTRGIVMSCPEAVKVGRKRGDTSGNDVSKWRRENSSPPLYPVSTINSMQATLRWMKLAMMWTKITRRWQMVDNNVFLFVCFLSMCVFLWWSYASIIMSGINNPFILDKSPVYHL